MFSAKEALTVQGGTSGTTWKNGGIENFTEGSFEEKASSYSFGDPKGVEPVEMPKMPVVPEAGEYSARLETSALAANEGLPLTLNLPTNIQTHAQEDLQANLGNNRPISHHLYAQDEQDQNVVMQSTDQGWQFEDGAES
jgi:uncharacterized protein (DUF2345 family)